jgi:hypothetical protein
MAEPGAPKGSEKAGKKVTVKCCGALSTNSKLKTTRGHSLK